MTCIQRTAAALDAKRVGGAYVSKEQVASTASGNDGSGIGTVSDTSERFFVVGGTVVVQT